MDLQITIIVVISVLNMKFVWMNTVRTRDNIIMTYNISLNDYARIMTHK